MQKRRDLSSFCLFVYTNTMKMHLKTGTYENEDFSRDFENREGETHENTCVNSKNVYLVITEAIGSWLPCVTNFFLLGLAFLVCLAHKGIFYKVYSLILYLIWDHSLLLQYRLWQKWPRDILSHGALPIVNCFLLPIIMASTLILCFIFTITHKLAKKVYKRGKMVTCNLLHHTASFFRCTLLDHGANKLSKGTKTVLSYFHINTLRQNIHTALLLTLQ